MSLNFMSFIVTMFFLLPNFSIKIILVILIRLHLLNAFRLFFFNVELKTNASVL